MKSPTRTSSTCIAFTVVVLSSSCSRKQKEDPAQTPPVRPRAADAGAARKKPGKGDKPAWIEGDLNEALRRAAGKKTVLMVVFAHWCPPCNQLDSEVLKTEKGQKLLEDAVGVKIDFDSEAGRRVNARYRIIGLPSTLVLSPEGKERGRVEGFDSCKEYHSALKDALMGKASLEALAKRAAAHPKDLDAQVAYAQARLTRGQKGPAFETLTRIMKGGGKAGARAARIMGRYLLRVKKKAPEATAHFLAAMKRFKGTRAADGFRYWAAKGLHAQGEEEKALGLFDRWIAKKRKDARRWEYKADFMVHFKYDPAATETVVRRALALDDKKAWPHYLLARVRWQMGDRAGAQKAAQRALEFKPDKAIFKNFLKGLRKKN